MKAVEPVARDQHVYTWELTVRAEDIEEWRRAVADVLRIMGAGTVAIAVARLGVSELLSNVVRHVDDPRCRLTVRRVGVAVYLDLYDRSRELPLVPNSPPDFDSPNGRGLWLLRETAAAIGYTRYPAGKSVWFRCDLAPPPDTAPP
jgi:anti-sigma regulatory factor (Ser/Thr protein kinase)